MVIIVQTLNTQTATDCNTLQQTMVMEDMAHSPTFHTSVVSYKSYEWVSWWDSGHPEKELRARWELLCRNLDWHELFVVALTSAH